jgi:ATP-binding cassette, subfamily B, beta-glucan exporter
MSFIRLYMRVLAMLGAESTLGWILAGSNLLLSGAMFVEPILFGRIIDTLAGSQSHVTELNVPRLLVLFAAWAGFALFAIVAGTMISLHADRLAHR